MKIKQKITILILALAFGLSSFTNSKSLSAFITDPDTGGGDTSCPLYELTQTDATFKNDTEKTCGSCTIYVINAGWEDNPIGAKYSQITITGKATVVNCKAEKDKTCNQIVIAGTITCPLPPYDADETGTDTDTTPPTP